MGWVRVWVLGAAAAASWAGVAIAQSEVDNRTQLPPRLQPAPQPPQQRPGMFAPASVSTAKRLTPEQRDEWRFLKDAVAASRFESDASRMALAKSSDAGVRSLAKSLVDHHASAGAVLDHMLHVRSIAPPMLANDQRKALNRLSKLQGRKFDREYAEVALRSQQENIATYERAAQAVGDPSLKAWIERTLPEMRSQLASTERISVPPSAPARAAAPTRPHAAHITGRNSP